MTASDFSSLTEIFAAQKQRALEENWPRYQIFGLQMASDYAFGKRLLPGEGDPDLIFTCFDTLPIQISWEMVSPTFASQQKTKEGQSIVSCWQVDDLYMLRYAEIADFYLWHGGVFCHLTDSQQCELAAVHVLPGVLALWLELYHGVPSLHGSAVKIDHHAVVFLGHKGAGKSTMAISFAQAGFSLLSDDTIPVDGRENHFWARPAYPQARLWPELVEKYVDHDIALETIQLGYTKRRALLDTAKSDWFCNEALPIDGIYILDRYDSEALEQETKLSKLLARDALLELMRFTCFPNTAQALGLAPKRLVFFSELVKNVPVQLISYPSDHDMLAIVHQTILTDLRYSVAPG